MKLRNQLLTLSLATLLVPWFGWKLVQELEQFLRAGQESALLAAARTMAQALPQEFQTMLVFGRDRVLPLRVFEAQPIVDGYADDWPEADSAMRFESTDGVLALELLAGTAGDQLFLFCRVRDESPVRDELPTGDPGTTGQRPDEVQLFLRSARGLNHFRVHTAAPGPLLISSQLDGGGQIEGYWQETTGGYHLELALPPGARTLDLSIGALDRSIGRAGELVEREAGTLAAGRPATWLNPAPPVAGLAAWLQAVIPGGARAWVVDRQGWVVAGTNPPAAPAGANRELSWAERSLYRLIAGERTELRPARPDRLLRFDEPIVAMALDGRDVQHWQQDPDNAAVRNTVAVPLFIDQRQYGAVVLEASVDGLLLVTNRALGRLLLATLLVTVGLAAGLWWFASRLSGRVQRLSGAVSEAMDDAAHPGELPLVDDRDELGELARNNARLLRSVADYTAYLDKLAGRLSHELKTPLAITRSSLDNLDSHGLDPDSRRFLERAREGVERQAGIVRAMSEATRLESAVKAADWEVTDLAALLEQCAEGYRTVHAGRELRVEVAERPLVWTCAPDLLVQALDKLVDNAISLSGPQDTVSLGVERSDGQCRLWVRNTGSRLPETLQDQLFDSLVSVRDNAAGGVHLGLGLHIVRLVAEAHGGTASARNLPGDAGVEFSISLAAA